MHDNLMADSDPESEIPSDTLGLRHISGSLFSIPGFFVGFGKGSSDSDSIRSPTSPLDIGVFSNLKNPANCRYARSSSLSQNGFQKEWHYSKVGLGIVNSLVDDTTGGVLDIPKQNIIFGSQVKTNTTNSFKDYHDSLDSSLKSKSLPTNYIASRLSQTKCLKSQLGAKNVVIDGKEVPLESEPYKNTPLCFSDSTVPSSLVSFSYTHNLRSENFCSEAKTRMSSSLVIGTAFEVENSLSIKPSTVPIPIGPSQGYVGSLSKREMELSEDYTCIISHGPNPKTIHIFGDCVLECCANETENFGKKEELGIKSPQVAANSEDLGPVHSDEVLTFCYSCKRKLVEDKDIYMYRGEKAFCSFDCCLDEISDEETEKTDQKSARSSPASSFHEDLFLLGMPVAM
ncbi:hypothetical protein L484_026173 [Morus notabilis]|uniref:FLZ-type domain-containing protein n=1 Tax=Morus notabilis TaxID=981085 RepID=W9RGT4_9ROSA|nr:uncharacterized protein LOC21408840 [Morus notabilis]XP_024022499.1 uncharacterized protein LOC21408840 [Morus notabilis]XP_024022500.1 uncharacterized protein LOC21408840 [Morus notabilis]XP_024022501.1 uncharacterized protein LOC21408840 [Morus notabilis]EXB74480.1 hypothetical protein L484_026173 [Morus notabilis]